MSDSFVRHFIATLATLLAVFIYWVGYRSGAAGTWWTVVGVFFLYMIMYKLIDL